MMPDQANELEKDYNANEEEFERLDLSLCSKIFVEIDRALNDQHETINPSFCDWSRVEMKVLPKRKNSRSPNFKSGASRQSRESGKRKHGSRGSTGKISKAPTSNNKSSSRSPNNREPSVQMKQNENSEVNSELFSTPIDPINFINQYRERKLTKLREKMGEIGHDASGWDSKLPVTSE
ncbi:unnamed protein product [Rodentolepis nana]|uniref:Ovule protein n=1 Tax=Rodentolepis nana TaxID=102285 RepID=A0A0R3TDX7_RODNA|nr:unnamed protein product [Rodentolepis nana]